MEVALTQSQIAGRKPLPQVSGFLCVVIADGQVMVPDWECADGGLFGRGHGELAHLGTGSIGTDEDGASNDRTITEGCNHTIATFVKGDVDKILVVLILISAASEKS